MSKKVKQLKYEDLIGAAELRMVRNIASALQARLPGHIGREDLNSEGCMALLTAARLFDPKRGVTFGAYAAHRVRGAMLDFLRGGDSLSRDQRRAVHCQDRAIHVLTGQLGRWPNNEEIAAYTGRSLARVVAIKSDSLSAVGHLNTAEEEDGTNPSRMPADPRARTEEAIERREIADLLAGALDAGLLPREKLVLELYFEQDWLLTEIGDFFGVNESRASQMKANALRKLRLYCHSLGLHSTSDIRRAA